MFLERLKILEIFLKHAFQYVWGVKQTTRNCPWQPEGIAQREILEQMLWQLVSLAVFQDASRYPTKS